MTEEQILRKVFPKDCIWEEAGHVDNAPFGMVYAAMHEYASQIHTQFLSYLDGDIQKGKALFEASESDEERVHISSCLSTLYDVKEKYNSLINTIK